VEMCRGMCRCVENMGKCVGVCVDLLRHVQIFRGMCRCVEVCADV